MRATSEPTERSGARRSGYHLACSMRATSEPIERSGARRSGHPSGMFHEDRERAECSPSSSTPRNNNGLSANLRKYLLQPKARSKSTTLRQKKRVTDSLTLHSIDKSIKHRVGGYTY